MASLVDNMADEWVASTSYSVGNCVMHNNKLYECIQDTSSATFDDTNDWKLAYLVDFMTGKGNSDSGGIYSSVVYNNSTGIDVSAPKAKHVLAYGKSSSNVIVTWDFDITTNKCYTTYTGTFREITSDITYENGVVKFRFSTSWNGSTVYYLIS